MVASGTSYSGTSFDIIYNQGGVITFSGTAASATGVTITTGYQ
jgi:hypothetical protein